VKRGLLENASALTIARASVDPKLAIGPYTPPWKVRFGRYEIRDTLDGKKREIWDTWLNKRLQ
jgi:hypothetical protein